MTYVHRFGALGIACLLLIVPLSARADSEIHISSTGELSAKRLTIMQIAGRNFFARGYWGNAFLRITLLANASTTITKSHGDPGALSDVHVGDLLDIEGTLAPGAETITVNLKNMRNTSADQAAKTVSGLIQRINASALTLSITDPILGSITVAVPASTPITKGARTIEFGELKTGDKIVSASGTFNYAASTLSANTLELYQDKALFVPRNFQGTLKSVAGTSLPTSAIIVVDGSEYAVYLNDTAFVWNKSKSPVSLARFVSGDVVRFFGSIRETNFLEVDARAIRDLNF